MAMKPEPFRSTIMENRLGPLPVEFRLYLLNKRLAEATCDNDNIWWEDLTAEFFEDNALLSISLFPEENLKQYTIGRTLIPRFFRSFYTGGVTSLSFLPSRSKEMLNHATHTVTLECPQTTMVSQHIKPIPTRVITDGHLMVEFTFDQMSRIRLFSFDIRGHCELILRQAILHEHQVLDKLSINITRRGITQETLNYLKLCEILEPMKEIMSRQKDCKIEPRDCLRNCLFQKWQRMMNPPDPIRGGKTTRRKRKPSAPTSGGPGRKKSFPTSDVMVVGEPAMMGGDVGADDERVITRLENQFDSAGGAIKMENSDPQNFPHNTSPAVRATLNTMSPWQPNQGTPQGRPPSQTSMSAHQQGPGSQTPSRTDNTTPDAMPNTPASGQN